MISGNDCPMCQDIHLETNEHSFLITELKQSFVRLPKNQYWPGWVAVFLKRHANELFELDQNELSEFWQDVSKTAQAVQKVFSPVKINYAIYGNLCPHLHCHIFPQQIKNDPHTPIKSDAEEVFLSDEVYDDIIKKIKKAL
ncbi:MAG: Histidine triad [Candidatus Uhrbacteria bacterium GW2011_GWE2_45_35]|uniref:Histidine triad n=2 Tax=Candidatus Uhriibacteriota TaxID=1752732 RepID=A0A0G1JEL3_9BACT|nr:MAG: Histidine triad [Candidatus Uhrbacteria bacterium GW2011_GWF2_44_350]KKU06856.1 MAG: Histidine triad [Candidatus Uhrbacteria bacterium GW2011_GWE2_45_35]